MNRLKQKINKMSNKERKVFYTASVVLFLLILLNIGGLSFAWFSALITGNDTAKSAVVETGSLSIVYTNSNELRGTNVMPGWTETKTFTVENTGTVKATYNINWNNLLNEFTNKEDLVYTITSDNNGGTLTEEILPESGEHLRIISNIDIEPGVIQTYTLTVTYKNKNNDQTSDIGKKLIGKIEVLDSNEDINSIPKDTGAYTLIDKYSEDNTEGLIKIHQPATVQTKATTEYRYSGNNDVVKNYVKFNNEIWRIIGVFDVDDGTGKMEKRIKITRDVSLGNYSWDSSISGINEGYGSNQWGPTGSYPGADLMRELNDIYYNAKSGTCYNNYKNGSTTCNFTTTGLKEESRKMIDDVKWYTGAPYSITNFREILVEEFYIGERSQAVGIPDNGQTITKTTSWVGKIGLIYPSDYGYATNGKNEKNFKTCYEEAVTNWEYSGYEYCKNNNWIYDSTNQYVLSPHNSTNNTVTHVYKLGNIRHTNTSSAYAVHPTLYLKSSVKITKGSGTSTDPYELSV